MSSISESLGRCKNSIARNFKNSSIQRHYGKLFTHTHTRFNMKIKDVLIKVISQDGFRALWRGLVPGLVMSLPSTSIFYVGYDHIRDYTRNSRFANTNVDIYAPLWAGGVARGNHIKTSQYHVSHFFFFFFLISCFIFCSITVRII